jgi:hypothetical protein
MEIAMPTCPKCGSQQPENSLFCDQCGTPLGRAMPALVCANCGTQLEPGSNFCDMCGAKASATPPPTTPKTPPSIPQPAQPVPPDHPPTALVSPTTQGSLVVQGTDVTLPLPPGVKEIVIGREDPASNVFPDIDLTPHGGEQGGVSRRHARILVRDVQFFIEDLKSTNGTYVNRSKLTPGRPHPLREGDEVWLGQVRLQFHI